MTFIIFYYTLDAFHVIFSLFFSTYMSNNHYYLHFTMGKLMLKRSANLLRIEDGTKDQIIKPDLQDQISYTIASSTSNFEDTSNFKARVKQREVWDPATHFPAISRCTGTSSGPD